MKSEPTKKLRLYMLPIICLMLGGFLFASCSGSDSTNDDDDDVPVWPYTFWCKDFDGDGYPDKYSEVLLLEIEKNRPDSFYYECDSPLLSEVDCNDGDVSINPDATEICADRIDNNCDGEVDEGCIDTDILAGLCSGSSEDLNANDGTQQGIFILTPDGQKSDWNNGLPNELLPNDIDQIEQVVCLGDEIEKIVQTCSYTGGRTVNRYRYQIDSSIYSALTAELTTEQTIYGSNPEGCPIITLFPTAIYGSHATVYHLLESYDFGFEFDYFSISWVETSDIAINQQDVYIAENDPATGEGRIHKCDINGNVISSAELFDDWISGLYHDGNALWACFGYIQGPGYQVCKLEEDGTIVECFRGLVSDEDSLPNSMYDITGSDGNFWIINNNRYEITQFNDSFSRVYQFWCDPTFTPINGIAHDGTFLWVAMNNSIYKCDSKVNVIQEFASPDDVRGLAANGTQLLILSGLNKKVYKINISDWTPE